LPAKPQDRADDDLDPAELQSAVIHRDLKPSNVLVSIQNDRAMPKIIDFGVAKATLCLTGQKRYAEAEAALLEAHEILTAALGTDHAQTLKVLPDLVGLYEAWDQPDKAAEWRSRLPAVPTAKGVPS
jgi:serine/threonine protein kinase